MKKIVKLLSLLTTGGLSLCACANSEPPLQIGNISVLLHNMSSSQIETTCMERTIRELFDLNKMQKLLPMRVEIDSDHTLVKKFYNNKLVEAEQIGSNIKLLISAEDKSSEVIVIRQNNYQLFELPSNIRMYNCLK
jgi:hypothetical protein